MVKLEHMRDFFYTLVIIAMMSVVVGLTLFPFRIHAQATPAPANFGDFEVLDQLPVGKIEKSIDAFLKRDSPLVTIANIIFQFGVVLVIAVGLIFIVIGGYIYMTAGGNAAQISTAKTFIVAALGGIVIALTGWLILNTISSQFTDPGEPTIITPLPSRSP